MKKRLYEINGVVSYAHVIYDEIEATSAKKALDIARKKDYTDPAKAETQEVLIDEPIEIKP